MTTILVGVDSSQRSLDAAAFAHEIAAACDGTVVVANVFPYDDRLSRSANLDFRHALERDAAKLVDAASHQLTDLGPDRVRTAVAARTSSAHGLQDVAELEHADLIVVGSSRTGALGRVMPGSTAERLLHGAPCPVAIVPKGYRDDAGAIRRIGVAYDGTAESDAALRGAVDLARGLPAELRLIRVFEPIGYGSPAMMAGPGYVQLRNDTEAQLRRELDEAVADLPADIAAHGVFRTGDPARELAAQSEGLDLIVTGSRGYGPLRAVLAGGVTGRLVRQAACPVLVFPRGAEAAEHRLFAVAAETAGNP